jgi:tetratricopeptide (TPR) repeat protein
MKPARFFLYITSLLLSACNSNTTKEENNNSSTVAIDAEEKKLRDNIAKYPDSALLKENLIQYFRENGNYDIAIAETDKAIKKDTANARLWDIKGTLLFENGDTLQAIIAFEKSVDLFPEPATILSLGSLYAQTKNPKALDIADALLIGKNANAAIQAIFLKGLYYSYTGDKQKALRFFNQCLAMDYTFMFAYREKGIALYDLGKYNDAIEILSKAITVQNSFDEGYYWRGRCYEKLNNREEAIADYQAAIEFAEDNDYPEAKDALARLGVK